VIALFMVIGEAAGFENAPTSRDCEVLISAPSRILPVSNPRSGGVGVSAGAFQ